MQPFALPLILSARKGLQLPSSPHSHCPRRRICGQARGAGTLIPSAQRLVWAAKQPLGFPLSAPCGFPHGLSDYPQGPHATLPVTNHLHPLPLLFQETPPHLTKQTGRRTADLHKRMRPCPLSHLHTEPPPQVQGRTLSTCNCSVSLLEDHAPTFRCALAFLILTF